MFQTLDAVDVKAKRILVRVDLNVPVVAGKVSDKTRIERVLPTIIELCERGGKVILLSHFGRPKGEVVAEDSLKPIAATVASLLNRPVAFAADCIGEVAANAVNALQEGEILLLENTRFHAGEEKNDPEFVQALAQSGDLYVNDAFSSAHRAHASTEGLAHLMPAFAGRAMQDELQALEKGLGNPKNPVVAIVGGAKVSTKIELLTHLITKVEALVIGGGMANTFLAAGGLGVGKSLCEHALGETARTIMAQAEQHNCTIILPIDATVAYHFEPHAPHQHYGVDAIPPTGMMVDLGSRSVEKIKAVLDEAATLVWNGPLGAFELPPFDAATLAIAHHTAELTRAGRLISIAGGGDTVSALNHAHVADDFSYISTAGGAFLEWMEGKNLPGVAALIKHRN